jgi:hypothetical protein
VSDILRLREQLNSTWPHETLVERLRGDAYALPSCGPWIERDGSTLPNNSCSQAADEIERLRAVLERIGAMDPATDGIEGYNEWGEADCFHKAQSAALMALGPNDSGNRRAACGTSG